jgi:hypothetical protein
MRNYERSVYKMALSFMKNESDAEGVAQEASQQTPLSIIFEGIDSRDTCGSDSKYSVQWNVREVATQSARSGLVTKRPGKIPPYAFKLHE